MNSEHLFRQAYALQHENKLHEAIALYRQLLSLNPQHAEALHFLGLAHAQLKEFDAALLHLLEAARLAPENASIHNNLGNLYKKQGRWDEAIASYCKAIELESGSASAHNNLATVYVLKKQEDLALKHYIQAVHAAPDFGPAHFNLGLLFLNQGKLKEARIQFNNTLSLNPDHLEALFYLGVLLLQQNKVVKAQRAFLKIIEHDPQHLDALINLGVVAVKLEQNQLAIHYFTQALAYDNNNLEARNNLAATFMHFDRFENALMHYDVLLQQEPDNIEYLYNSGVAQMALGHLKEAIDCFNHILKLDSTHSDSLSNLGVIYQKMEQFEKSCEYLQRALEARPDDKITTHLLNALQNKAGTTTPEYARNLFDNYALYYEQHMREQLKYSIPSHIGSMLHELNVSQVTHALELGCGTGLSAGPLREVSTHLTGIDVAEKMVAQAAAKKIYDSLEVCEIIEFFKKHKKKYDLIVAADVLPYFGDLDALFCLISEHLQVGHYFICTTEISDDDPYKLEKSARFSHHFDYVTEVARKYELCLVQNTQIPGRLHHQKPVMLNLFAFQKAVYPCSV